MKSNSLFLSLIITAGLLTVTPQLCAQSPSEKEAAKAIYIDGRNLLDDGSYVEAEKKFREVLAKYPRAYQPDRTTYYLITTLIKQGRRGEALAEISSFDSKYPRSPWKSDVEEKRIILTGSPRAAVFNAHHFVLSIPFPPQPPMPGGTGANPRPMTVVRAANPSLDQERIRMIVLENAEKGIAMARERLRVNPTDPAVISNFSTIANSGSPQAFQFFVFIADKGPNPNTQTQALFYLGRLNNNKDAVGKGLVEMVNLGNGAPVVAEVLSRSNPNVTRAVLNQIVQYPSEEKLYALERVYDSTSVQPFRVQIVQSAGSIPAPAARDFLTDVANEEQEVSVRFAAIQSLSGRKDVDLKFLHEVVEKTLITLPVPVKAQFRARTHER